MELARQLKWFPCMGNKFSDDKKFGDQTAALNNNELEPEYAPQSNTGAAHTAQAMRALRCLARASTQIPTTLQQNRDKVFGPSLDVLQETLAMPAPTLGADRQKSGRLEALEGSFGTSFADVDFVVNSQLAASQGARALAQNDSVHLQKGSVEQEDPTVVAHELVHILQKRNTSGVTMTEDELEHEAHELGARAALGENIAGKVRGYAPKAQMQFWLEPEHRYLGNQGAKTSDEGVLPEESAMRVSLAPDYHVEFGEITAMSGDYFTDISEMRRLAENPIWTGVGTREELEYVRVVKVHGRESQNENYSQEVKTAVEARYRALGTSNASHFSDPRADRSGRSHLPGDNFVPTDSNQQAYRSAHEQAIEEAIEAGRLDAARGDAPQSFGHQITLSAALATEAAGSHFLTDAFASGHVRTPRIAIGEHWNQKVPMFPTNMTGWIANTLANHMTLPWYLESIATTDAKYHGALEEVLEGLGDTVLTFGDVVSGVFHDLDNHHGLAVMQNGDNKTYFGDGMIEQMQTGTLTSEQDRHIEGQIRDASQAVAASIVDVRSAYRLAKQGMTTEAIFAHIAPSGVYHTEALWPAAAEVARYEFPTVEALFEDPHFQEGARIFAAEQTGELVSLVPEEHRDVFQTHVIDPLVSDPVATLRAIINWTPDTGGGVLGHNQDDNAMEYYERVMTTELGVCALTEEQRERLQDHIDGGFLSLAEIVAYLRLEFSIGCETTGP